MMQEPWFVSDDSGSIEVICGGMFSGKTEELLRRARRAVIAGQRVILFKPSKDVRYSRTHVVSHDRSDMESIPVRDAEEIPSRCVEADVVCVDEAQFFDHSLVDVANELANRGQRIIIAGLDMDFEGKPFEPVPQLLAVAEFVTKLHAVCTKSGRMAHFSERISGGTERILIGEAESYEPRARHCFKGAGVKTEPAQKGRT